MENDGPFAGRLDLVVSGCPPKGGGGWQWVVYESQSKVVEVVEVSF